MIFRFTTLNTYQETRPFFYQFDTLENGFEFLNRIVSRGDTLLSAFLIESGYQTSLPVDAFDGSSFLSGLKQLALEWEDLLSRPFQADIQANPEINVDWYQGKLRYYEQHIISLELMISDVIIYCEQRNDSLLGSDKVVITRYNLLLKRYQAQVRQAYSIRDLVLARLYNSQPDYQS